MICQGDPAAFNEPRMHLLIDDLHEDTLPPSPVGLSVKNLIPGTEVELTACNGDHHFPSHDLPLQVGAPGVRAGPVVMVSGNGLVRSDLKRLQEVPVKTTITIFVKYHIEF